MLNPKQLALLSFLLVSVSVLPACGGGGTSSSAGESAAEGAEDSLSTGDGDESETGDGEGADSGDGDSADTGDGDSADTGDGDSADTGDGDSADTGDGDSADTGDEDSADTGDEDSADTVDEDSSDTVDEDGVDTDDVDGAGAADGSENVSAGAGTVVFAIGGPVPGLVDSTFTSLNTAAIAPAGDTCVSAGYDQGQERLQGVWCGFPDSPQQILRSGDTIDNLPANIVFESAASLGYADNGNLLISANVSGASNGSALLLWDGQSIQSILRTGELAPGFSDGSVVATMEIARLSNAGAVIQGTSSLNFGSPALWLWDGSAVSLITQFLGTDETLPTDQNNCLVTVSFPIGVSATPSINNNGVVAFQAMLDSGEQTQDSSLCRGTGIVQKVGDTFTTVVRSGDAVPATETAQFQSVSLNALFDSGAMSITSALEDDNASGLQTGRLSTWIFESDGTANLVSIVEETVPPGFVDRITLIGNVPIVIASSETTAVQFTQTSLGLSLLAGAPHSGMPYPDIGAVGATSMSLIASSNSDPAPGFADETFISSFSRPAIDLSGRVYYRASVQVPSENTFGNAFYTVMEGQTPALVFANGSRIDYAGESQLISNITFPDAATLSLVADNRPGVFISQQGDALVPVTLEGFGAALIHVSLQ